MATLRNEVTAHLELPAAIAALRAFGGLDLTRTLSNIENLLTGATEVNCAETVVSCGAEASVITAAGMIKRLAGEIHVVIHALGILLCLPHILKTGEIVESVSLGAGNTGKAFDLETNRRIAEFKFIRWQGGAETIRQNALFKDFYLMAEHSTHKEKYLYVLGTEIPLKFFTSGRALSSILSHSVKLQRQFDAKFGDQYRTVREYYLPRQSQIILEDVSPLVPELVDAVVETTDLSG